MCILKYTGVFILLVYSNPYKKLLYVFTTLILISNSAKACSNTVFNRLGHASTLSNILGAEYGYGFNLSPNHKDLPTLTDKSLPAHHLAFDIGWMGIGRTGCKILSIGLKGRYEYGFDAREYGTHRLGIESYYHPRLLSVKGFQIASLLFGIGGRLDNVGINGGTYVDVGMLILPTSPVHASLYYRADFIPNAPTNHSMQLTLRFPFMAYPALAITAAIVPIYTGAALVAPAFLFLKE